MRQGNNVGKTKNPQVCATHSVILRWMVTLDSFNNDIFSKFTSFSYQLPVRDNAWPIHFS